MPRILTLLVRNNQLYIRQYCNENLDEGLNAVFCNVRLSARHLLPRQTV